MAMEKPFLDAHFSSSSPLAKCPANPSLSPPPPFFSSSGRRRSEGGVCYGLAMAATSTSRNGFNGRAVSRRHVLGGSGLQLPKYLRVAADRVSLIVGDEVKEGPSCIFVGPLETADREMLESLYQQARDSYYNGKPLIVDDMFDKVEIRLRWYGSRLVYKYPRCSLKRFSAYSDAEVDRSQMLALMGIWSMLLAFGLAVLMGPPTCALHKVCREAVHLRFASHGDTTMSEAVAALNETLAVLVFLSVGIPVANAAFRALQTLWRGELVALKGSCPNCGEEVYAFLQVDKSLCSQQKTDCHVCEHPLVFRAKVERSEGQHWAYGRVYLATRSEDLFPRDI